MIIMIGLTLSLSGTGGQGGGTAPVAKLLLWGVGNNLMWGSATLQWGYQ